MSNRALQISIGVLGWNAYVFVVFIFLTNRIIDSFNLYSIELPIGLTAVIFGASVAVMFIATIVVGIAVLVSRPSDLWK